jgi:hypothetical protein
MTTHIQDTSRKYPLVHHVFFWLNDPLSLADRDQLAEGIKTLAAIPSVKYLHVGIPAGTENRDVVDNSWQVSEIMFFENLEAQSSYQDHPLHKVFVNNYGHLWKKVIVYDAMEI